MALHDVAMGGLSPINQTRWLQPARPRTVCLARFIPWTKTILTLVEQSNATRDDYGIFYTNQLQPAIHIKQAYMVAFVPQSVFEDQNVGQLRGPFALHRQSPAGLIHLPSRKSELSFKYRQRVSLQFRDPA